MRGVLSYSLRYMVCFATIRCVLVNFLFFRFVCMGSFMDICFTAELEFDLSLQHHFPVKHFGSLRSSDRMNIFFVLR